jgi:hypothetical protein
MSRRSIVEDGRSQSGVGSDLDGVEEAADGLFVHGVGGEELLQAVA